MSKPAVPDAPTVTLCNPGPFSDLLMATACFPGLKEKGYRIKFITTPLGRQLFQFLPEIDQLIILETFTEEAIEQADRESGGSHERIMLTRPAPVAQINDRPVLTRVTHHFCKLAGVPPSDKLFIKLVEEHTDWGGQFQDTVVFCAGSHQSAYQEWPLQRWQELAQLIRRDFGLEVAQLNTGVTRKIPGVRLEESPSVLHTIGGLRRAFYFIGVDNFLNHASQALQKPIVVLWGSTHPQTSGYGQNVNIVNGAVWKPDMEAFGPTLRCQPCHRVVDGLVYPDTYPEAYHLPVTEGNRTPCPHLSPCDETATALKDHPYQLPACMAGISVEAVFNHIAPRIIQKRPALEMRYVFSRIYHVHRWENWPGQTSSREPESLIQAFQEHLDNILSTCGVKTFLDAGCGDLSWITRINPDVEKFIGCDIVPAPIEKNQRRYGNEQRVFEVMDVTQHPLPQADLVMSRDLITYLPFQHIRNFLRNVKKSGAPHLLITTHTQIVENQDTHKPGEYHPVNLQRPPFNLPEPVSVFQEATDQDADAKSLGLWRTEDLPDF